MDGGKGQGMGSAVFSVLEEAESGNYTTGGGKMRVGFRGFASYVGWQSSVFEGEVGRRG